MTSLQIVKSQNQIDAKIYYVVNLSSRKVIVSPILTCSTILEPKLIDVPYLPTGAKETPLTRYDASHH